MKTVIAIFPDTATLADFILDYSISNAIVDSKEQSLTTQLTDQQISLARTKHQAYVERVLISGSE